MKRKGVDRQAARRAELAALEAKRQAMRARSAERAADEPTMLAEGYRPEELASVRTIRERLASWLTDPQFADRARSLIHEWKVGLETKAAAGGPDPRAYRYFHTISGSTLPKDQHFDEQPDVPSDSVFALMERIEQERQRGRSA